MNQKRVSVMVKGFIVTKTVPTIKHLFLESSAGSLESYNATCMISMRCTVAAVCVLLLLANNGSQDLKQNKSPLHTV